MTDRTDATATPADTALLIDAMCGGLRSVLRMAGYDAAYALERGVEADEAVRELAERESRTLITRDRSLAAAAADAVLLQSRDVDEQLAELEAAGFALDLGEPRRCSACNGTLDPVPPGDETPAYAPDSDEAACARCRSCGRVYWKGSHWEDVADRLAAIRRDHSA
ncbi:MAG: Mut7-C RNAse domain-containing protein [Halanaeroarchaeum sp.]